MQGSRAPGFHVGPLPVAAQDRERVRALNLLGYCTTLPLTLAVMTQLKVPFRALPDALRSANDSTWFDALEDWARGGDLT